MGMWFTHVASPRQLSSMFPLANLKSPCLLNTRYQCKTMSQWLLNIKQRKWMITRKKKSDKLAVVNCILLWKHNQILRAYRHSTPARITVYITSDFKRCFMHQSSLLITFFNGHHEGEKWRAQMQTWLHAKWFQIQNTSKLKRQSFFPTPSKSISMTVPLKVICTK